MKFFLEFLDNKQRKSVKQLKVVSEVLQKGGLKVKNYLEDRDEPYLYVFNPKENDLEFDGIRIYKIGDDITYRIQKRKDTHPYGKAYKLPIEEMFDELIGEEDMDEKKIGNEIIEEIINEIKSFFKDSAEADRRGPQDKDPLGSVYMRSTGTDYANQVHNQGK